MSQSDDQKLKMASLLRERAHLRARIRDIEGWLMEHAWGVLERDGKLGDSGVGRFVLERTVGDEKVYLAVPSLRRWTADQKEAFVFVSKADAESNIGPSTAVVVPVPRG